MAVRWIVGARREAHQHADAFLLRIGCKQLAGDAGRRLVPFRFRPPLGDGSIGSPPVSAAMRWARRPQSETGGRSTSVGQEAKESMIGRSVSISCRHSAHSAICASNHGHLAGREGLQGVQEHSLRVILLVLVSTLNSWFLHCPRERLAEFHQSRTDSCLHSSERLIQLRRHLVIRQLGEERGLDDLSLLRCQDRQGLSQEVRPAPRDRSSHGDHSSPPPEVDRPDAG